MHALPRTSDMPPHQSRPSSLLLPRDLFPISWIVWLLTRCMMQHLRQTVNSAQLLHSGLGLDTTRASCCLLCPDIALDIHWAIMRHAFVVMYCDNQLRDVFVDLCHRANPGVKVEALTSTIHIAGSLYCNKQARADFV